MHPTERTEVGFAIDSPLEGTGFEPSVPPDRSSGGTYPADVRSDAPTLFSSGARRRLPLESDRRPLPDPATSFANSRYFRPVRPKRPASTSGTRSSNPLSSSRQSVSAVNRRPLPEEPRGFAALGACTGPFFLAESMVMIAMSRHSFPCRRAYPSATGLCEAEMTQTVECALLEGPQI